MDLRSADEAVELLNSERKKSVGRRPHRTLRTYSFSLTVLVAIITR